MRPARRAVPGRGSTPALSTSCCACRCGSRPETDSPPAVISPAPTPTSRSPATPAASGCASTSTAASVHRRHRADARSVLRHRAALRRSRRIQRGPGSVSLVSGPFELARDCSYAFVARPIGMADFSARQSSSGNGSSMGHPRHIRTCDVL
ncbi:hypothetical protein ADL04_01235 [Streptomyces sp. NRRL B-3648]|nr:hypothetical protein ADL04_01235 [Streptomyces sp. NRRL B-3648]